MGLITQNQYNEIISWFKAGGKLMTLGCTPRPSQQLMVDYITAALDAEQPLLCEAPTGVGKTFSYLFPLASIIADSKAQEDSLKVVISTSTKNLQKQLKSKDFPSLKKMFPNVKTHTWMGASNYLCGVRLRKVLGSPKLTTEVKSELEALDARYGELKTLQSGWREDLPFEISDATWDLIHGDTPCCNASQIKDTGMFCHKRLAYQRAKQSDILCVNHSLFCNLALHMGAVHPGVGDNASRVIVVIDEAHDLDENLRRCLNQDFNIGQLKRHCSKILTDSAQTELQTKLSDIRKELLEGLADEPIVIREHADLLIQPLRELTVVMKDLSRSLLEESDKNIEAGIDMSEEDAVELANIVEGITGNAATLSHYLDDLNTGSMLELSKITFNKSTELNINFCPFDLKDQFQAIWKTCHLPILTSATLFNGSEIEAKETIALPTAATAVIPPNFNYGEVIRAYCLQSESKTPLDNYDLAYWVKAAIEQSAGHALVLFTSYSSMNEVHGAIREWVNTKGYSLLVQSRNTTPAQLTHLLATVPNTIIFGTNTYWTGVDIKGKQLSNVIITKLPFRMLDNYAKYYGKFLEEKGLNPFFSWAIPDMVNRTRQGLGRLIRDDTDKGLVFMLDPRFTSSTYGRNMHNRIYPDVHGKTTIKWTAITEPEELPIPKETQEWLGVKEVNKVLKPPAPQEYEDDDVPF